MEKHGAHAFTQAIGCTLMGTYLCGLLLPRASDELALQPDKVVPRLWTLVTCVLSSRIACAVPRRSKPTLQLFLLGVERPGAAHQPSGSVLHRAETGTSMGCRGMHCTPLTNTHTRSPISHTPHVQEFLRFILLVSLSVGTGTFVVMYFLYVLTRDQFYLFARFGGFHGVVAGLLVALRQMAGDEAPLDWMAASLYVRGLRNKHLAPLYVVGTLLLALLNGARHHHVGLYLFVLFGAYSAWLYLRFWQDVSAASGGGCGGGASSGQPRLRGDPRPEFSFAACFPEPCHPLITRLLAAPCHRCCCAGEPSYAGGAAWLDAVHAAERGQGRQREQQERGRRLLDQRLLHPPSTGALSTGAAVELATPAQVGEEEREPVAEGVKDSAV